MGGVFARSCRTTTNANRLGKVTETLAADGLATEVKIESADDGTFHLLSPTIESADDGTFHLRSSLPTTGRSSSDRVCRRRDVDVVAAPGSCVPRSLQPFLTETEYKIGLDAVNTLSHDHFKAAAASIPSRRLKCGQRGAACFNVSLTVLLALPAVALASYLKAWPVMWLWPVLPVLAMKLGLCMDQDVGGDSVVPTAAIPFERAENLVRDVESALQQCWRESIAFGNFRVVSFTPLVSGDEDHSTHPAVITLEVAAGETKKTISSDTTVVGTPLSESVLAASSGDRRVVVVGAPQQQRADLPPGDFS